MMRILKSQSVVLIDVRSKQEYKEGHLDGSINIPLFDIRKEIIEQVTDRNKAIIVYCDAGIRSFKAQKILNALGYKNVYNLEI